MAGIRTEERVVDGTWFQVTQLSPMRSTLLLQRLAKTAGPGIVALIAGGKSDELDPAAMSAAAGTLFEKLTPEDLQFVIRELLSNSQCEFGEGTKRVRTSLTPELFDSVFADQLLMMFKVLGFALEVNYRSFCVGALKSLAAAAARWKDKGGLLSGFQMPSPQPGRAGVSSGNGS